MQLPGSGNIPFAMRVPAAPAAFRNRLDRAALAQLDSLILTIGNFRSLAPERRAQRQRKGIVTLFCGGRGTGKTTAAQLLARETGEDLYIVDPCRVIGRYAGETEKHLDALLTAAQANDVILFFEEADALFGRRRGAGDHGDRYAKVQINYLLGRLEAHAGLTIFACDLRESIDPVVLSWCDFVFDFQPSAAPGRSQRFRCPQCGLRVFNRRVRSCEKCRAPLPEEFAYTSAELERIERDHRENLESLRRSRTSEPGVPWTPDSGIEVPLDFGFDLGFDGSGDGGGGGGD